MQTVTDFDILRTGTTEYVTTFVRDPKTDDLTDVIGTSQFKLIDIADDTVKVSHPFTAGGGVTIDHPSTGVYQYNLNTVTYPYEYLASYRCLLDGEIINNNVFVKSVPSRYFAYAASLRLQVDKARKSVSDDIANMDRANNEPAVRFQFGFDDKSLIFYLERGMQIINAVPPYTAMTVADFDFRTSGTILIDAATIAALESQGIFAIDTDYSYSLGGNSLVIDHFTKLSSAVSAMIARFDKQVISWKQQFRAKGCVMFQWQPGGVRAARQLSAMPSGFWSRMLSSVNV